MSDCIDRQTLINLLTSRAETLRGKYGDLGGAVSGVRKLVQTLSSVEPERKKGKWIFHIDDLFPEESTQECSVCHAEEFIKIQNDNFCPNCGADMRNDSTQVVNNPPLTWDELKLMEGKPIWVVRTDKYWRSHWAIVEKVYKWDSINDSSVILQPEDEELFLSDQGETWQAYRLENL